MHCLNNPSKLVMVVYEFYQNLLSWQVSILLHLVLNLVIIFPVPSPSRFRQSYKARTPTQHIRQTAEAMIGTSAWDYVLISACIFGLKAIVPISIFYSFNRVAALVSPYVLSLPRAPPFIEKWMRIEAAFYILFYLPRRAYLQTAAKHPALLGREQRRALFRRCYDNITDPERYLCKWFRDAPQSEIKRENVAEFLQWAFFNGQAGSEYEDELDEYVRSTEERLGRKLEPGRGAATCLRLTLDQVEMLNKSVLWYVVVCVIDVMISIYLRYYVGFQFRRLPYLKHLYILPPRPSTLFLAPPSPARNLSYWYRPHTSRTRLPILFIHGIGIGIYPYAKFLADLAAARDNDGEGEQGIIAIEILQISSRITSEAVGRQEMCEEIDCIVKAHGWEKFVLISHS